MSGDTLTGWVLCWRIDRRDGVTIGLTGHDHDLWIDGLHYRAAPGLTPSAILRGDGLDADLMEASGALTSEAIGEHDLLGGRWDGARVSAFAVDWADRTASVPLGEGTIGAVQLGEGGFSAELRGIGTSLDRPVAEETSPDCRATLGDRRCRVAMAGRRRFARVTGWDGAVMLTWLIGKPMRMKPHPVSKANTVAQIFLACLVLAALALLVGLEVNVRTVGKAVVAAKAAIFRRTTVQMPRRLTGPRGAQTSSCDAGSSSR